MLQLALSQHMYFVGEFGGGLACIRVTNGSHGSGDAFSSLYHEIARVKVHPTISLLDAARVHHGCDVSCFAKRANVYHT